MSRSRWYWVQATFWLQTTWTLNHLQDMLLWTSDQFLFLQRRVGKCRLYHRAWAHTKEAYDQARAEGSTKGDS